MNDNSSSGNGFLMAPKLSVRTSFSYCLCERADTKGSPKAFLLRSPLGVVERLPTAQRGPERRHAGSRTVRGCGEGSVPSPAATYRNICSASQDSLCSSKGKGWGTDGHDSMCNPLQKEKCNDIWLISDLACS